MIFPNLVVRIYNVPIRVPNDIKEIKLNTGADLSRFIKSRPHRFFGCRFTILQPFFSQRQLTLTD